MQVLLEVGVVTADAEGGKLVVVDAQPIQLRESKNVYLGQAVLVQVQLLNRESFQTLEVAVHQSALGEVEFLHVLCLGFGNLSVSVLIGLAKDNLPHEGICDALCQVVGSRIFASFHINLSNGHICICARIGIHMVAAPTPGTGLGTFWNDHLFQHIGVQLTGSEAGGLADIYSLERVRCIAGVRTYGQGRKLGGIAEIDILEFGLCGRELLDFRKLGAVQDGDACVVDVQLGQLWFGWQGEGFQGGCTQIGLPEGFILAQVQRGNLGAVNGHLLKCRSLGYVQGSKASVVGIQAGESRNTAKLEGGNGSHASDLYALQRVQVTQVYGFQHGLGTVALGNVHFL